MKARITLKNVFYYIQGNLRYKLYYSPFNFLIREHIKEQIDLRVNSMRRTCYDNGVCDECGCTTIALQMANKACEGACYPSMQSKKSWKKILGGRMLPEYPHVWKVDNKKFKKYGD